MYSTPLVIAALAAAAAAVPLQGTGSGSQNWGSQTQGAPYPTGSGGYQGMTSTYSSAASVTTNPTPPSGFVAKLLTDDSTVDRFIDLQDAFDDGTLSLKFDFNVAANPGVTPGEGGQVDLAFRKNFPILTDLGISAAGIFFNPCGLNTPHIHPRASEFLTVATDSNILTGFVLENGLATEFNTTLTQFQGTVFPQGSIHFQQNLDCKPAVAIAGLNSEDPGASSIAQNFIVNLDPNVVDATLGFPKQIDADNFAEFKKHIPITLANGVEECLIRCHIPY